MNAQIIMNEADEICSCCDNKTYFICYTCGSCDNCCDCQACCDCQEVKIACNIQTDDDGKYYCGYCWETRPANDEEDDEEDEDLPECCGKYCDETTGLKLGMGWYKYHSSVADMITEQLWCENCYTDNTGHECKGCSEYFPYTEMTYKEGGGFGEACYCYDQFFCKSCVASISSIDYDPDEYA